MDRVDEVQVVLGAKKFTPRHLFWGKSIYTPSLSGKKIKCHLCRGINIYMPSLSGEKHLHAISVGAISSIGAACGNKLCHIFPGMEKHVN